MRVTAMASCSTMPGLPPRKSQTGAWFPNRCAHAASYSARAGRTRGTIVGNGTAAPEPSLSSISATISGEMSLTSRPNEPGLDAVQEGD
jgi:hypothetical protein